MMIKYAYSRQLQALKVLLDSGVAKFVISQNVDGLCTKCGISRDKLSELHGNVFVERCPKCKVEYVRDFEIETVSCFYSKLLALFINLL